MKQSLDDAAGYLCMPFTDGSGFSEIIESLRSSDAISEMYFSTMTFSPDSAMYFPGSGAKYVLAKYTDRDEMTEAAKEHVNGGYTFAFGTNEHIFSRSTENGARFMSPYFFGDRLSKQDMSEVVGMLAKSPRINYAGVMDLEIYSGQKQKFTFPYKEDLLLIDVSDGMTSQAEAKHCEKLRKNILRKGHPMYNLFNMPRLQKIK